MLGTSLVHQCKCRSHRLVLGWDWDSGWCRCLNWPAACHLDLVLAALTIGSRAGVSDSTVGLIDGKGLWEPITWWLLCFFGPLSSKVLPIGCPEKPER